jgi:hypothetical protein
MMVTRRLLPFLLILLFARPAFSQRFDYDVKQFFADSVKKVTVWTYIKGDSTYGYYQVVADALKAQLNAKGYAVSLIRYDPDTKVPVRTFMNAVVAGLGRKEAFLVVATQVKMAQEAAPSNGAVFGVMNPYGAVILTQSHPGTYDSVVTKYSSLAVSQVYMPRKATANDILTPDYSRTEKGETPDIALLVSYSLNGMPKSRHPSVQSPTQADKDARVTLEIRAFGGYLFGSSVNITEGYYASNAGQAKYAGNWQYGMDISLGLSRRFDVFIQYHRSETTLSVNTPEIGKMGPQTISENFYLAGTTYNLRVNDHYAPFFSLSVGGVNTWYYNDYFRDVWYFALGAQAGAKFYFARHFGISLQGEAFYQVHPEGAPLLYTKEMNNIPVNCTSNMIQGGLSAGIFFRLGNP